MRRSFRTLSIATTAVTLVLIGWGGLVRATGSGDGCPDWPRCFGRWIPRFEYHTLIEYVHRALAVTSGLLALALAIVGIVLLVRRRRHGTDPGVPDAALWLAIALAPLFAVQGALGGWVVLSGLHPTVVTIHFAVAFVALAIIVAITTLVVVTGGAVVRGGYARLAAWTAVATYVLLLIGTHVRAEGAGLVFRDWPLMGGRLIPSFELSGAAEMALHRGLALVVAGLVIWLAVRARTMRPRVGALVTLSTIAAVAVLAQVVLGGLNVVTELAVAPQAGHVAVAAILWAAVVALAVAARRTPAAEPAEAPDTASFEPVDPPIVRETIRAYVALTKPRIITLLLITTVPAMILAANGMPSLWLIAATLIGGAMAAGAANAINMYLDRDIDEVMKRTRQRPLPRHRIEPEHALRFGFWLGGAAFAFLALAVNLLSAVLALAALAFYVFVYTMWLKRSTDQNIVIGGAAGAVPVLVGWAAVTGSLAWPAWILFAVIFVWTPPHFWALAMKVRDDYAMAGVPMMPVVRGEDETRRHIFLYALVLFATTLLLVPVASMGPIYLSVAVIAGGLFVFRSLQLWRTPSDERAWGLFKYSVVYLGALFGAVALDALVRSAQLAA